MKSQDLFDSSSLSRLHIKSSGTVGNGDFDDRTGYSDKSISVFPFGCQTQSCLIIQTLELGEPLVWNLGYLVQLL